LNNVILNKCKNKLHNIPSIIIADDSSIDVSTLELFSNFFIIGVNDSFFYYQDCDLLILDDINLLKKHYNKINGLRSIKICLRKQNYIRNTSKVRLKEGRVINPYSGFELHNSKCAQDIAVQIAHFLGCSPILMAGFNDVDNKCRSCLIECKKWLKKDVFSITQNKYIGHIDPFIAYSKYNDKCPDKLDILKRLI